MSKASSNAITSSTVSSESAPRSSTNEALEVTSPSSTPNCSTTICFTFSSKTAIFFLACLDSACSQGRTAGCGFLLGHLRMLLDVIHRILHGADFFRVLIGNLDVEALLEGHDQLHGVERVGAQVIDERGAGSDFALVHTQLLHYDLLYFFGNLLIFLIGHRKTPLGK